MYFCCLRDFPASEGSSLCLFELLVSGPCYNPALLLQNILHKDCLLLQIIISYSCKTLNPMAHFLLNSACTLPNDAVFYLTLALLKHPESWKNIKTYSFIGLHATRAYKVTFFEAHGCFHWFPQMN